MGMSEPVLDIESVRQHLSETKATKHLQIHYFESIDSTNLWLLNNGKCGDVCIAEKQTQGYGRRGRRWHSPAVGNLYFSLKVCFDELPKHYSLLSLQVAICLAETLEQLGAVGHRLKWPNDLYIDGKKLGGILLQSNKQKEVVIGIGLNINMPISENPYIDQEWDNIRSLGFENMNLERLFVMLLDNLSKTLNSFSELAVIDFVEKWNTWDMLLNQAVEIVQKDVHYQGEMIGIDQAGCMRLMTEDGTEQVFSSGEVSVRLDSTDD